MYRKQKLKSGVAIWALPYLIGDRDTNTQISCTHPHAHTHKPERFFYSVSLAARSVPLARAINGKRYLFNCRLHSRVARCAYVGSIGSARRERLRLCVRNVKNKRILGLQHGTVNFTWISSNPIFIVNSKHFSSAMDLSLFGWWGNVHNFDATRALFCAFRIDRVRCGILLEIPVH